MLQKVAEKVGFSIKPLNHGSKCTPQHVIVLLA